MVDIGLVIIVVAAFLGALGAGIAGWLKSGSPFAIREFYGTIWAAFLSAALFAMGFELHGSLGIRDFLFAFLSGAGVDVLNRRLQGQSSETYDQAIARLQSEIKKLTDKRTG